MLLFTYRGKNVRSKWIQKVPQVLCEIEVAMSSVLGHLVHLRNLSNVMELWGRSEKTQRRNVKSKPKCQGRGLCSGKIEMK